jgi:transcriptional regulator with XRE-family HTH domain
MSNRIRQQRERRGWSQEQLAAAAGTSPQTVSRLETGARQITERWLNRLSVALGCAPADLLPETARVPRTDPSVRDFNKLDQTERMLIDFWRSLPADSQDIVIEAVTRMAVETIRRGSWDWKAVVREIGTRRSGGKD